MIFYRLCNMYIYIQTCTFQMFRFCVFKGKLFFPSHIQLCFDCERFSNKSVEFLKRRFSRPQLIDKFSNWADDVLQQRRFWVETLTTFAVSNSSRNFAHMKVPGMPSYFWAIIKILTGMGIQALRGVFLFKTPKHA